MKRVALVLLFGSGCTTSSTVAPATPTAQTTATPPMTAAAETPVDVPPVSIRPCPPDDEAEREHCVWMKGIPGVSGAELAKRMKAAGFPMEVEGDKVWNYWTAARVQAFFGVKPTYVKTGAGSAGMVCLMVLPKGAKPAVKSAIAGWAIDDPACEM